MGPATDGHCVVVAERPRRIARNTLLSSITTAIGTGAGLLASIVIARGLGPSDMGVYTLVTWTAIAITTIVSAGVAFSAIKFIAQYNTQAGRETIIAIAGFGLRVQLALAVIGGSLLAVGSGLLAELFGVPQAQEFFALSALVVVVGALIPTIGSTMMGLERQGLIVPLVAAHGLGLLAAAFLVLNVLHAGIGALIASQIIVGLALLTVEFIVASRLVPIRIFASISSSLRRRITAYATSMTVTLTLGLVVWQRSEVFILGLFRESSEVAYYSIAFAMSEAIQGIIPIALGAALFPNISRAFADRDHQFAQRAYESALRLTTLAVVPVAIAGALQRVGIQVLYGDAFDDAAMPLAVLLFSAGAQRVTQNGALIVFGSDRERLMMWFTAAWAAFNVTLAFALTPRFGVAGATAANAATQFGALAASHLLVRRTTGFRLPAAGLLRILAANIPVLALVGLVVWVLDTDLSRLVAGIAVVLPAYALGLWLTGALRPLERRYLAERLHALRSVRRR